MSDFKHKIDDFFSHNIIWCFLASAVTAFLCHGAMLFSDAIGIDGELAVLNIEAYDYQGRPGVHWIRRLFEVNGFNLYCTEAVTFLLLIIAPLAFLLLFNLADKEASKNKWLFIPFIIAFLSSPYWVAQLYFLSQSIPVLVTLIAIPVACFLIDYCIENFKEKKFFASVAGLFSVFLVFLMTSVYQVQVLIFVQCVCALFFIKGWDTKRKPWDNAKWILTNVLVLVLGLLLYFVVIKNFYSDDLGYLGSQIGWSTFGFSAGVKNVINIVKFSLGGGSIYSKTYLPAFVALLIISSVNFFGIDKERRIGNKIFLILVEAVIFITPYAFPVLYGQDVSPRMRYTFPVAEAIIIYLLCREIKILFGKAEILSKRCIKVASGVVLLLFVLFFAKETMDLADYCNRLYYTNEFRYEQDYSIARDVKRDIELYIKENELDRDQVLNHAVFLGKPDIYYNEMCLPNLAVAGASSWRWDDLASMVRYRIYYFMDVCGYGIGVPPYYSDGAKIAYYLYFQDCFGDTVENMNVYPYDGYIQYLTDDIGLDYLVIKLGYEWDAELLNNRDAYKP